VHGRRAGLDAHGPAVLPGHGRAGLDANGPVRLGLVGSPNSGKTTLFNALTGLRARVGNYPGVTVERREGEARVGDARLRVIDLPGVYSLAPLSPDEAVVARVLGGEIAEVPPPDGLVLTVDACSIERSLLLVAEVLRLGRPVCLALTMVDELHARGGKLDAEKLADALGVPVVPVVGHRGLGVAELKRLLPHPERWSRPPLLPPAEPRERDDWLASVLARVLRARPGPSRATEAIDRVVLHPIAGTLLFAVVMVLFFQLIFAWATPAMDAIDAGVATLGEALRGALPAGLFTDFLVDGVVAGVGSVVVFLPQILLLFTLLHALEDLGYMARAAFVVDRLMGRIGLEGRAFVALLSSYACAVPGIMATRTIPSPRQRLVTILVSPLMTCSARLPVYALLIGAFVPPVTVGGLGLQGLVLLGLYGLGATAALVAASLLSRTVGRRDALPFYLELPPYRVPPPRLLAAQVWGAARAFLRRAGTIILAVSIALWVLLSFPRSEPPPGLAPAAAARHALEQSAAGRIGHALEPWIAPLGFDWKIGVGLVASLAAREVIVATLAQIYAASDDDAGSLREALRRDVDPRTGRPVFTPATVAALLVFFVFALQCTSTLATMRRETNSWRWPAFAFGYLLALAYGASFVTHRIVSALVA
jgi:ferrous iron transport protein B